MKKNEFTNEEMTDLIRKGLELTFKKLLEEKRKNNAVFVFSENGVIKKVKATDIKN